MARFLILGASVLAIGFSENVTTTQPLLRGAAAAAANNATLPKDEMPLEAGADEEVSAEGWFDWGHAHPGETCCMCSYQVGGPEGTVILYAGEDYDHAFGGHTAFWHCEHECEHVCNGVHGHKFGCLDEAHLRRASRALRRTPGFRVEHQQRRGNLC